MHMSIQFLNDDGIRYMQYMYTFLNTSCMMSGKNTCVPVIYLFVSEVFAF